MDMKKIKVVLLVMFMAITLPFSIEHTYSYWADDMLSPVDQSITSVISIGSWGEIYSEWSSSTSYTTGDIVTYSGRYYRATRNSTGVPPRGVWYWWFFWTEITV